MPKYTSPAALIPSRYTDGAVPRVVRLDAKKAPSADADDVLREVIEERCPGFNTEGMTHDELLDVVARTKKGGVAASPDLEAGAPAPGAQGPNAFDDRHAPRGPVDAYDVARELFAASARPTRADADEIPDEENVAKAIARRNHRDANAWRHPVGVQRGPISAESAGSARTDAGHVRTQEDAIRDRNERELNAWKRPIGASR